VNCRKTLALLVVLALCLTVPAGLAGSAVQVGLADTDAEVTGVLHKDASGGFNGDDDRWGDATPVNGDPDEADPGDEGAGGGEGPGLVRAEVAMPDYGIGFRIFVDIAIVMFLVR